MPVPLPSDSLFSRLYRKLFPDEPFTPEMNQGIDIARKENPSIGPIEPYGMLDKMFYPNTLGLTTTKNRILLNQRQAGQTPEEWADTITHEQEHVNQQNREGYSPTSRMLRQLLPTSEPYGSRPTEMGAFQAEKQRRDRMHRMQAPIPSSSKPGEFYTPSDINLPYQPSSQVKDREKTKALDRENPWMKKPTA